MKTPLIDSSRPTPKTIETPLLAQSWLITLEGDGAAAGTVRAYRIALTALAGHLGRATDYTDATKDDLRRWLLVMRDAGLSQNTIRQRIKIARAFYRWLVAEGECERDPSAGVKPPPEVRPDVQTLSVGQTQALLGVCAGTDFDSRRDMAILCVLLDAGLRRSECAGLELQDVDVRAGTLHVVGKGTGRRGPRHRTASIGRRTQAALTMYLRVRARLPHAADTDALWLSVRHERPMTPAGIRFVVEKRGRRAGLELHAHMARHTWASEFRRAGGNEGDLMLLGGWSNRRELDRYGRADAGRRAVEAGLRHSLGDRLRRGA